MKAIHGGDIYRNRVKLDFSVNINPLGMPEEAVRAMRLAAGLCCRYPDPEAEELKKAVSVAYRLPAEWLLFGNGASELFLAAAHGLRPEKVLIPVPSFYGYEHAAKAAGSRIRWLELKRENGFRAGEELLSALTPDIGLLFLANPNNPTGALTENRLLAAVLERCQRQGIVVVLDECFIEFCGGGHSLLPALERFPNLCVIRAFTKIYAIPGVRLGWLACADDELRGRIAAQLPEWNLSCFAQAAGCACAGLEDYVERTRRIVRTERAFLKERLEGLGIRVFPGEADFLLLYAQRPLYEELLGRGILIRDCTSFRGLGKGFYRIAVKSRRENEILLQALRDGKEAAPDSRKGEREWKD